MTDDLLPAPPPPPDDDPDPGPKNEPVPIDPEDGDAALLTEAAAAHGGRDWSAFPSIEDEPDWSPV